LARSSAWRLLAFTLAVASSPLPAQVPDWSLEAQGRLLGGPAADQGAALAERRRLLDEGEARLAGGDALAAQQSFDRASQLLHAADTELSLVRTYMQAGEYRRALAFGAHAAGAHREFPAGNALYAWLLQAGGQGRYAERLLAEAIEKAPDDPSLQAARAALGSAAPRAEGVLATGPARVLPYAWGTQVAAGSRVVGSGTLAGAGDLALVPSALVNGALAIRVRNGLGQTVAARLVESNDDTALLKLERALPRPPGLTYVGREPFAGSPGYCVEQVAGDGREAAWPLLRSGFFAYPARDGGLRPLGIEAPPGPRGGPVFDAAGRLAGLALTASDGRDRLLPVSAWPAQAMGDASGAAAPGARLPLDELYERALLLALQVIVLR